MLRLLQSKEGERNPSVNKQIQPLNAIVSKFLVNKMENVKWKSYECVLKKIKKLFEFAH